VALGLDLLQLHCPPSKVYDMPEVFGILDDLVKAGKLRYYGVSVERVEEALNGVRGLVARFTQTVEGSVAWLLPRKCWAHAPSIGCTMEPRFS